MQHISKIIPTTEASKVLDNVYIQISYHSVNGGVNNLQVAKVYTPSQFAGIANIIKTFSSKKNLAEYRAKKFIKKISR